MFEVSLLKLLRGWHLCLNVTIRVSVVCATNLISAHRNSQATFVIIVINILFTLHAHHHKRRHYRTIASLADLSRGAATIFEVYLRLFPSHVFMLKI